MNLKVAEAELERKIAANQDPKEEESVVLGYVDGAEVCLMGWDARNSVRDVRLIPPHANAADSMQVVLQGGMQIYYPDDGATVTLRESDCHVVQGGRLHACVSSQRSLVLVVVGHRARQSHSAG